MVTGNSICVALCSVQRLRTCEAAEGLVRAKKKWLVINKIKSQFYHYGLECCTLCLVQSKGPMD